MTEAQLLEQIRNAEPGTLVVYRRGGVQKLDRRKPDGTGWWLTDGSGLADRAYAGGDWRLLDDQALALLFDAPVEPAEPDYAELIISPGDEEIWPRCSCGMRARPFRPDEPLEQIFEWWHMHAMRNCPKGLPDL